MNRMLLYSVLGFTFLGLPIPGRAGATIQEADGEAPVPLAPGAVPAGRGSAYARAREIPARIMDFTVEPAEIEAGETVSLVWATENPSGVTIEPGLGRVTTRGSRELSPEATTTYTLTVTGPNDQVLTRSVTVTVPGTVPVTGAASRSTDTRVPRTADGRPDLSGVYDFRGPGGGGRGGGRGGAPGAGPVLKEGADEFRVVRGPNDTGALADCMPLIGSRAFSTPYQFQIVQNEHYLVILYEYPGTFRIIPTDGRPHQVDPDPSWLGDSVGNWEGDTLVIDTIGFNDRTEIAGFRHTRDLHIVERISRPDFGFIHYEATIEDPNVFEGPFTESRDFAARPDLVRISEFICENNRDYSGLFGER